MQTRRACTAILEFVAATDTSSLEAEYRALTEGCGLLDRSERGKLALTGAGAKEFLAGQVTNDIEALAPGSGCYAAFLTPKGKMLGDLRVLDLGDVRELLLDTERVALQALFDMIRRFKIGYEVELHKRTVERGLLSLIGPGSDRIAGTEELPAAEHANVAIEIDGIAAIAVRTDLGVDLICDAADTEELTKALHDARRHAGLGGRPLRSSASSTAGRATGSTSTRPSSPRRRA